MDILSLLSYLLRLRITDCNIGDFVPSILEINIEDESCLILFCTWRLEHNDSVLLVSTDADIIERDTYLEKLKILNGKRIIDFSISPQLDLMLILEDGYCINTFCNISYFQTENGGDWDANWRLAIAQCNMLVCATNEFQFKIEKYDFDKLKE